MKAKQMKAVFWLGNDFYDTSIPCSSSKYPKIRMRF